MSHYWRYGVGYRVQVHQPIKTNYRLVASGVNCPLWVYEIPVSRVQYEKKHGILKEAKLID